ncbi:HAD family hydrolase [Streptomyces sp. NPDC001795]|uniref:HAD family hydrolase n=1 Tax=Streptomyces sp. NPDC001795 TaxID=3154525 RepID=UPI00332EB51D
MLLGGEPFEKPDPRAFLAALDQRGVLPARAAYVGNRLHAGIRPTARLGMRTVWMLRGEAPPAPTRRQLEEPDAVITSLTGLPMALARLANRHAGGDARAGHVDRRRRHHRAVPHPAAAVHRERGPASASAAHST